MRLALFLIAFSCAAPAARAAPDAASDAAPVTPNASQPARQLLMMLAYASHRRIFVGQHDYLEDPDRYAAALSATTGHAPALHGYELGAIMGQDDGQLLIERQRVVRSAVAWHSRGGLVAMSYHQRFPGLCSCWSSVGRRTTRAEFDAVVTPGTPLNKAWLADLDRVAAHLTTLRDHGVPVLWRPYHEMNGDWFWWGGQENFARLWRMMFERLVGDHGLNNLIWVWSPNAPVGNAGPYQASFPGTGWVDVLALDIYAPDFPQGFYDGFERFAHGKPIAIGETGSLPPPELLAARQPGWVWAMTWGKLLEESNDLATIKAFVQQPRAVTRSQLPSIRRACCSTSAAPGHGR